MSTDLENILSGQGASAPAPEPRNEPQPEQTAEPQRNADPASESEPQPDERGNVPVAALTAEREKGKKRYTEAVESFERRLAEQAAQFNQRFDQLVGNLSRQQPAQAEQPKEPDYWDDPNAFVQHGVQQAVSPVLNQLKSMQRGMAEMMFRDKPGAVDEAERAFNAAVANGSIDPVVHARINGSPNPWAAAVQWHQHTQTMAEIGSDPAAYKTKLRDELKAELMAELQQGQQQPDAARPAPVAPSNFATGRNVGSRAGPAYAGPSPLDEILGSNRR